MYRCHSLTHTHGWHRLRTVKQKFSYIRSTHQYASVTVKT